MRSAALARRAERTPAERAAAATALTSVLLAEPSISTAKTIAAYWPFGDEPSLVGVVESLHDRGATVLLPIVRPDGDLDWAPYTGSDGFTSGRWRFAEPAAPALGPAAITGAAAVLVPALAVDGAGGRLGRGSGSYDRALARVASSTPVIAIVYDDEVVAHVPVEQHDRSVSAYATPGGVVHIS